MSIPSTVWICNREYSIARVATCGVLGACDNGGQDITLSVESHPETQATVLLHEVIEAINGSYNLGLEHHAIDVLETALYGVLVSNEPWWDRHFQEEEVICK